MNHKVRGTSKNSSVRANKSKINELHKTIIKEHNQKTQITRLRQKIIKELKELVYRQTEKHKSDNTCRRINGSGLKRDR